MKIKVYILCFLFIFFTQCGYEKINQKDNKTFEVVEIYQSGEERVNYALKKTILLNSSKAGLNKLKINLTSTKTKSPKEKNITNTITKYSILLTTTLEVENIDKGKNFSRTIVKEGFFQVAKTHSETQESEKNITKDLTNALAEDIINFLNISLKYK